MPITQEMQIIFGLYDHLVTKFRPEDQQSFVNFFKCFQRCLMRYCTGSALAKQSRTHFYRNLVEPGLKLAITVKHLTSRAKYCSMQISAQHQIPFHARGT